MTLLENERHNKMLGFLSKRCPYCQAVWPLSHARHNGQKAMHIIAHHSPDNIDSCIGSISKCKNKCPGSGMLFPEIEVGEEWYDRK